MEIGPQRPSPALTLHAAQLTVVLLACTVLPAAAAPIDVPIINADFEADAIASPGGSLPTATGWSTTAGGGDGVYRPTADDYIGNLPSGQNVGYVNGPGNFLRQILTTPLEASTRYRLTVEVGWNAHDPFAGYILELRTADGTLLASDQSTQSPSQGTFVTVTLEYVSPIAPPTAGQALQIRLRAPDVQANYDDVRLTAEAVGACADVQLVPFYLVQKNDPNGANTLFAVRNLTADPVSADVEYHAVDGTLQRTDTIDLDPYETVTVSVRDVAGLAIDPDGFARGYIRIVTTGTPDRSPVLGGDFFQVDVANNFATGERMVHGGDLCSSASLRTLDFGAGTRLVVFLDAPRGAAPASFTVQARNEAGMAVGAPIGVQTSDHVLELSASDFTTLAFGSLAFDFSNSLGGTVYAEYSADGRFSVGTTAQCQDAPRCAGGDCCPAGTPKAIAPPIYFNSPDVPDCTAAIGDAVRSLTSFHYRSACQATYGGDLPSGVLGTRVLACQMDEDGAVRVDVEVCCPVGGG